MTNMKASREWRETFRRPKWVGRVGAKTLSAMGLVHSDKVLFEFAAIVLEEGPMIGEYRQWMVRVLAYEPWQDEPFWMYEFEKADSQK